ncbi:unnamed protein product (macronuclear) [Paramecium tetraurelia]|uniref:60S ribosomal protein L39 n=1 Tax=Paramecium tetraurelia TaxID=5888 RepID=A0BVU9_PARTE|nr:uncharacterized protein GSPATT00032518001 [Paramecium tetraurelia]CAK62666.1 unnamed protein product [Paramecium tetraurelia]|eukprot:XP_001430064.1 hypothetical protein (macronuclear) [Paramecium tetraurelia strain d4-2]
MITNTSKGYQNFIILFPNPKVLGIVQIHTYLLLLMSQVLIANPKIGGLEDNLISQIGFVINLFVHLIYQINQKRFKNGIHILLLNQGAHKSLRMKKRLIKANKQNRPLPNWFRYRTDNTIRYNSKRRHWRRTKLNIN